MVRSIVAAAVLAFLLGDLAPAQPPATPAADAKADELLAKASELEAELNKQRDTSPEAAPIMLQLVDIYYGQARVFGLIRVAERFVASHAQDPRHKEVMLKLLDGLLATSRNKEISSTARQYLSRYPEDPACGRVEMVLASALEQQSDYLNAADVYAAVWTRQGNTPEGRDALVRAYNTYAASPAKAVFDKAALLADSVVDRIPPSGFVAEIGLDGVNQWRRGSEWVKSNLLANKLLQKGVIKDPVALASLHRSMGESYSALGQRTNSVESFKKARALADHMELHVRLIQELHNAGATFADMEPVVNEYMQKYPEHPNRFGIRSYLAYAAIRADDKPRARAIIAEVLPFDATLSSTLVSLTGPEPADMAATEQILLGALAKNPAQPWMLRYSLALELYRDRMKDLAKARRAARELVTLSPSNEHYTQQPLYWLLYSAENDAEFQADVQALLKVRVDEIQWAAHRDFLPAWIREAKQNKDHKDRAAWAEARLAESNQQQFVKDWLETEKSNSAIAARARLLTPESAQKLNDRQAYTLFSQQAYALYASGNAAQRTESVGAYAAAANRFPADPGLAYMWAVAAANYGPEASCKDPVLHQLKQVPTVNNHSGNLWYYLLICADRAKDPVLVRQIFDWIQASQQKLGPDITHASYIGDVLEKYEYKAEALAYWRKCHTLNRDVYESRSCAERIVNRLQPAERIPFLQSLISTPSNFLGTYSLWLADDHLRAGNLPAFEKTLTDTWTLRRERPRSGIGFEEYPPQSWVDAWRGNKDAPVADKVKVFTAVRDLQLGRPSAAAGLALFEVAPESAGVGVPRLLAYQKFTTQVGDTTTDWDRLMPYAQNALVQKDYIVAATVLTGMLSNIPQIDVGRQTGARDLITQSYTRIGGVGLAIDENSPIAPLLQAALYLRLGDERLAFETYMAQQKLFDEHRTEVPIDLLLFICESHIAAGGDENHNRVEDILTAWLVRFSEAKEIEDETKASVQLLLARNFFKSQRFDVSRSEFTTVVNRYPATRQAIEAEFGIGEAFMAQKVYDQAEAVFEKLAGNRDRDIVIRAEFLRGVLASRRGDRDEARDIFKSVLERVPSIELANQALFNLSEVYGAEQRYLDQLELLRTIGRLGRSSKRWHAPGESLSIVVQDSDLGISRGHAKIPVRVTTSPGGDEETIYLYSGGAGKGLFRADLETTLGRAAKNDKVLQLTGKDTIKCDYPDEFKAEFKNVPLSDAEILIASNAKLEASSSKIIDKEKESFSDRLEREAREQEEADKRLSQGRPVNQVKPGNLVYLRVQDADRDLSDEVDTLTIKLSATSGDQVQVAMKETGSHTGIFEATAATSDLPAGALASDTAIEHSPLMAIDQKLESTWISEPDGATPKWLSVDMKDLREVARVAISSPDPAQRAPVRGELLGSNDGRFWFRLGENPAPLPAPPVAGEFGKMTARVFAGNFTGFTTWNQVVDMSKNRVPVDEQAVEELAWKQLPEAEDARKPYAVLWHGKLVQPRAGAARIAVQGNTVAIMVDGRLELPLGRANRFADVWLETGTHDLTIFAATTEASNGVSASWTRSEHSARDVVLHPFRRSDFDLDQVAAKPAKIRAPSQLTIADGVWNFEFPPIDLRHIKFVVHEYVGEALAINHVQITGLDEDEIHIPTKADVLSLANNNVLEIASGDTLTASYTDEFTQSTSGRNQLLTANLMATYYDAGIASIAYEFTRDRNGNVNNTRKELIRIDPGERLIVEVTDYDMDQSGQPDTITIQVAVNDGEPIELTATETEEFSGVFTKEIDTSSKVETGKLTVKPGDRVYCTYVDTQNTFPGHAVPREVVVYVNEPTEARVRIVETRVVRPPMGSTAPPQVIYLPTSEKKRVSNVAFEAPLTVEVYDRDAAKDSRSKITVQLVTTDGSKIDVECVVSAQCSNLPANTGTLWALEEGRFIGQVVLQLGSKNSPDVVPISTSMPRNLIGRGLLPESEGQRQGEALVTRVLNVSGKDVISAVYQDVLRPKGKATLKADGRLIANGTLQVVDRNYEKSVEQLHVGEKIFLMVSDADLDTSDERDRAKVEIVSARGDKEVVELEETLAHSGVFTGSVGLKPTETPTPGNLKLDDPFLESYFGDLVTLTYVDAAASTESGTLSATVELPVVVGTDGQVFSFSKAFNDEQLAVETKFHIAESYFELFKSHKALGRVEEQKADLENGNRVLREVLEDYPSPKYVPRIAYLRGQFAQELQNWDEAIEAYQLIVRQYSDHTLAPDAQYKLAQCHEEAGKFDEALEDYVTLAATYPNSPLIANVMIRISDYFYRDKNFDVAAQVGEKFLEKFEGHQYAPRMAFRIGQCYYKAKEYVRSGKAFDRFAKIFPDDVLCSDALFWSGESYRMGAQDREAFRRYNKCRWDFPASEAAKYARGRLALPNMLNQFESEANSVEDE